MKSLIITGIYRSGTTLIQKLLNASSQTAIMNHGMAGYFQIMKPYLFRFGNITEPNSPLGFNWIEPKPDVLSLFRTTDCNKNPTELKYSFIKKLNAGKQFNKKLTNSYPPTLQEVLLAIPQYLSNINYEILILDDCSQDKTFTKAKTYKEEQKDLNVNILRNKASQGYGGNQKIGLHYAIKNHFDILVVFPPDGKYSLKHIETLIDTFEDLNVDMLLGSRTTSGLKPVKKMPA